MFKNLEYLFRLFIELSTWIIAFKNIYYIYVFFSIGKVVQLFDPLAKIKSDGEVQYIPPKDVTVRITFLFYLKKTNERLYVKCILFFF